MLDHVHAQWDRVVFMQTNREDLGDRWKEVLVPVPGDRGLADDLSKSVRSYYKSLAELKTAFLQEMSSWK